MTVTEKVAYLKGLMEGLEPADSKEMKIIKTMVDILDDMSLDMEDIEATCDDINEHIDAVDQDLSYLEDDFYEDDDECDCDDCDDDCDCDDCDDDEEYYQVTCPNCNEEICMDEDTILSKDVCCPNCGTPFEFDLDGCDSDDDNCDCGCGCGSCGDDK